jgi:hypothetical protein
MSAPQQQGTLVVLAKHLLLVLDPLSRAFTSPQHFKALVHRLGWNASDMPDAYVEVGAAVADAISTVQSAANGSLQPAQIGELLGKAAGVYEQIEDGLPPPTDVNAGRFAAEIGERLAELLLTEYLSREWPQVFGLLQSLDVIRRETVSPDADKRGHSRTVFDWDEIPKILQDPHLIVQRVYGWGTDELRTNAIMRHLATLLHGLRFPVSIIGPDRPSLDAYSGNTPSFFRGGDARGLKFPFYYDFIAGVPIELSFQLLPLEASGGKKPGLVIQPGIPSSIAANFPLGDALTLTITAGSDIANQFGILIRPEGLSVKYPFMDASTIPSVTFGVAVAHAPPEPVTLLGDPAATRLQMKGFSVGLEAKGPVDDIDLVFRFDVHELSVVLAAGDGDGFLRTILGDGETKIDVPLGIDWSGKHGLGFRGSLNFEVQLHPHLELGPLKIPDLRLSLTIPPDPEPKTRIEAVITLQGELGPLAFVAEGIGIQAITTFQSGNLGPLDMQLGFRPPNGVGLSIDAGAVRGGGYLFFDFEREEYAGVLQLSMLDMLTITAIGLITTRMPDGSQGFSLLVILSVEFNPGIQLGFGFTLIGLGGILGLNRTMMLEALAVGVRNGTLNSIMFPTGDIIAQAPRIISDLRAIFPPEEGKFLIGPMAKIGWGTPTLISISLGVIIEIPGNIAIIGVLRLALPTVDAPLVIVQVAFMGAIEFDRERLFFFATLFESRILFLPLEGDMGALVAWGDDSALVVTVGGFHPRFEPPPLPFPDPRRLSLSILDEEKARIRVEAYLAVTSNTAQLGATAQLYFGFSSFRLEGYLGFDALFRFSPFYFVIDVRAGLTLKVFGVDTLGIRVTFTLEGPTPWHAHGTGSVSILFWDIDVDFDKTWGDEADTVLPPILVLPLLQAELEKAENWKAALPPANCLLVSIRDLSAPGDALVMHPLGILQFSQRLVPVGLTIDKVGNQATGDVKRVDIEPATTQLVKRGEGIERFAMAQFVEMDDAEKLSRPAFEPAAGGIELGVGADLSTSHAACRNMRYEEIWIDSEYKRHQQFTPGFDRGLFDHFLDGSAVTKNPLSKARRKAIQPFSDELLVTDMGYVVADADTNELHSAGGRFASHASAKESLRSALSKDPSLAGRLVILPECELAV